LGKASRVVAQGKYIPWEESPGSTGQGAGDKPGGRKVTQGPQKTDRPPFWEGKGETVG